MRILLFITWITVAFGSSEPYMLEGKIQSDLENALSRVIPREQFLVQVISEMGIRNERRLVEGETLASVVEPEEEGITVAPMPGFVPEPDLDKPPPKNSPVQNRQIFRMVETPFVQSLRVNVNFDESLTTQVVAKGRNLVQSYLRGIAIRHETTFGSVPMLKPEKPIEKVEEKKPDPKEEELKKLKEVMQLNEEKEKKQREETFELQQWGVLAMLALIAILLLRKASGIPRVLPQVSFDATNPRYPNYPASPYPQPEFAKAGEGDRGNQTERKTEGQPAVHSSVSLPEQRMRLMDRFLARSEAFKLYHRKLTDEERSEVYFALRGPAYDGLLEGLGMNRPALLEGEPPEIFEKLVTHTKRFDEFVQTKEWQDRQFFGFLNHLSDEQIISLVNHESPSAVCLMLRFLKPNQAAFVLDILPPLKRVEVLSQVDTVQSSTFGEIVTLEGKVRASAQKVPSHLFGSKKDDVDFWGNVIGESLDQDSILEALEKTQPAIYPSLAKFKFKLDDVGTVPQPIVEKVLGDVDNEELGMALAACKEETQTTILSVLSPKRREVLHGQILSYKGAANQELTAARINLTKKLREAIA